MKLHTAALVFLLVVVVWGYIEAHQSRGFPVTFLRLKDAFATLKTGDLLFTKSGNWTSRVQQYFFGSFINHVAMIFKASDGLLWIWDLAPQVGAYMTPLQEFIRSNWAGRPPTLGRNPVDLPVSYVVPRVTERFSDIVDQKSALFVRRLHKPLDQTLALQFIQRNLGRPYSWRFWLSAFTRVTGLDIPLGWKFSTDPLGMFCSELLGHTFVHAHALDGRKSPPSMLLPNHFWENELHWTEGQGLHAPEQLIGTIPDIVQSEHVEAWEAGVSTSPKLIETLVNIVYRDANPEDHETHQQHQRDDVTV